LPRKTDSNNPADWLHIVDSDMEVLRVAVREELGYSLCRSKLAEALEKIIKAELIRTGWPLEKTHDLETLHGWPRPTSPTVIPVLTWKTRTGPSCANNSDRLKLC
jgi:hypothetical protein